MGTSYNTSIVRDGLVLHLDAANKKSYPGSGNIWYDLSGKGNNATIFGSPVFANGRALFNGTDSYAEVPFNPVDFAFDYEQTIIIVLSPTENDAVRRNPYNQAYGGGGSWTHETNGVIAWYYGTAGVDSTPYTTLASAAVLQNETAIMASTRKSDQYRRWYKNGALTLSSPGSVYTQVITGTRPIQIGKGYSAFYIGYIDSVMVYNKSLTSEQIKQNFLAVRRRHGL